ncbi:MAG: pseudouridine synthase [Bacteroidia bacterium]|nr:pseudouridine synthase [Bacteroidia bacterium]
MCCSSENLSYLCHPKKIYMRNKRGPQQSGDSRGAAKKPGTTRPGKSISKNSGPARSFSKQERKTDKPAFKGTRSAAAKNTGKSHPAARSTSAKPFGKATTGRKPAAKKDFEDFTDFPKEKAPYRNKTNDGFKREYKPRREETPKEPAKKSTGKKNSALAESGIRLNKFISNSGICSRREADMFIEQGVVKVNGKIVTELGYRVQPADDVQFDGKHIRPEKPVYLLLNKPKDYLTSMDDDRGRRTVMNLIKDACKERVYPVGRLDRNTTGLLLFTNDGEMADKLMHPRKSVKKIYMVELTKNLKEEHIDALRNGVVLEDGFFKPDVIEYVHEKGKIEKAKIGVEIHSGRNRIVRRLFEHFGYTVVKLDRVTYAGLTKKNLPRGKWRFLDEKEINLLKML